MNFLVSVITLLIGVLTLIKAEYFELNRFECGISSNPSLIINGSTASPGQFPWMVNLVMYIPDSRRPQGCGGSIITRRHVLTAAHCIRPRRVKASKIDVYYGHNNFEEAKKVAVEKMLMHEAYTTRPMRSDIGILLVKEPFQYSAAVGPLCLPPRTMNVLNRNVVAAGWGRTQQGQPATNYLQYTTLRVAPDGVCKVVHGGDYARQSMICAHNRDTTVCHGDSGGPLFIEVKKNRFVQIGIASYVMGSKTHCVSFANVFTRVDAFMPWIKENIGKHEAYDDLTPYQHIRCQEPPRVPYAFWDYAPYESPSANLLF